MLPITAGLGALSYLTSLLQSTTASTGTSQSGNPLGMLGQIFGAVDGDKKQDAATVGCGGTTPPFNSATLASLISLQAQKGEGSKAHGLFVKLDTNGDGTISKEEFENVLGGGGVNASSADALFGNLDSDGDNSVSQSEFAALHHGPYHHRIGGALIGSLSSLLNSIDGKGAKTETTTNEDGLTTTTVTYADGSTVSMTTPALSSDANGDTAQGNGGSTGQINLLERLIKLQSQYLTQSTSGTSTVA